MTECLKCERLMELYERTPKDPRDYWLMTELFVMLHGGDVCPAAYGTSDKPGVFGGKPEEE